MASTDKIEAFLAEQFRAIGEKHGLAVPHDEEHLRALAAEGRVLLAFTPDRPPSSWTVWGLGLTAEHQASKDRVSRRSG